MKLCTNPNCTIVHEEYFRIKFFRKYDLIENDSEFIFAIADLLKNPMLCECKKYIQHKSTNCYQHQLSVAYYTYKICKLLNLSADEAARGAMLHDFFLYDWHKLPKSKKRRHPLDHPKVSLENAKKYFDITKMQEDIILNHMWPLCKRLPRYKETYVVTIADKFCCLLEVLCAFGKKYKTAD